jgi:hypothetical protein
VTEREQLQLLWKIIDQMDTAASDIKTEGNGLLKKYIRRKAAEARLWVRYPGEPPDLEERTPDVLERADLT